MSADYGADSVVEASLTSYSEITLGWGLRPLRLRTSSMITLAGESSFSGSYVICSQWSNTLQAPHHCQSAVCRMRRVRLTQRAACQVHQDRVAMRMLATPTTNRISVPSLLNVDMTFRPFLAWDSE